MDRRILLSMASAGLALAMSGCDSFSPPPLAVSKDSYTPITKAEHKLLPEGVELLSLESAQDIAVENNPSFRSQYHAISAARAKYYQSFSGYFPTITAAYGINQNNFYPQYQNDTYQDGSTQTTYSPSLSGQWTIFDSLVREMNLLAAKHNWKQTEALEQDSRRLLLKSVANAYNNILLAVENKRIALADMDFNEKLLKETELKFEAGAVPLSDVLNFRIKYNNAESNLVTAEYNYLTTKYALAVLMGLTEGDLPSTVKFPPMPSADGEHLADVSIYLDTALANRPDLKAYREALEVAKYTEWSNICSFGPTVTANSSYYHNTVHTHYRNKQGTAAGNYGNTTIKSFNFNWGGSVSWEIFSGGKTFFAVRAAQANVAQSEFQLADNWLTVISDVRTSYDNYNTNVKQAKLYKKTLELVKKTRDLVEEEYKAGNAELTRLNEAQRDLVQAETNMASAVINMQNAKAQLDAATNAK